MLNLCYRLEQLLKFVLSWPPTVCSRTFPAPLNLDSAQISKFVAIDSTIWVQIIVLGFNVSTNFVGGQRIAPVRAVSMCISFVTISTIYAFQKEVKKNSSFFFQRCSVSQFSQSIPPHFSYHKIFRMHHHPNILSHTIYSAVYADTHHARLNMLCHFPLYYW